MTLEDGLTQDSPVISNASVASDDSTFGCTNFNRLNHPAVDGPNHEWITTIRLATPADAAGLQAIDRHVQYLMGIQGGCEYECSIRCYEDALRDFDTRRSLAVVVEARRVFIDRDHDPARRSFAVEDAKCTEISNTAVRFEYVPDTVHTSGILGYAMLDTLGTWTGLPAQFGRGALAESDGFETAGMVGRVWTAAYSRETLGRALEEAVLGGLMETLIAESTSVLSPFSSLRVEFSWSWQFTEPYRYRQLYEFYGFRFFEWVLDFHQDGQFKWDRIIMTRDLIHGGKAEPDRRRFWCHV